MNIPLERTDGQPLYLQVKEYLRGQIENGAFPPGTRLTPTRRLATELGVNRITVVNAYAELESEENPTYLGAIDIFEAHRARLIGVPLDEDGLRVDLLENLLVRYRPKIIYTVPTFQNPTGMTMNQERREWLLALARRYGAFIMEDGVCNELRYEGTPLPPVKGLDREGRVIYVGSFSKTLLPGIRVGYADASGPLYERLVAAKQSTDLHTPSLMQGAVAEYLETGRYPAHLERIREAYRARRDVMVACLAEHLPGDAKWTIPQGGLCLWVSLPGTVSITELYLAAINYGVAFTVGSVFFPERQGPPCLRLTFSANPDSRIEEGIRRLGVALRERLTEDETRPDVSVFTASVPLT